MRAYEDFYRIENEMKHRLELVFGHILLKNIDETPDGDVLISLSK
jgi:hypothetical protein